MIKKFTLFIFLLTFSSGIVFSQSSGKHKHDGFFLRLIAGPSYSTQTLNDASIDMNVKGISGSFNCQVGAEIAENLNAFGEVAGFTITNPEVEIDGKVYDTDEVKSSCFGFGGGLTYYFMPSNFYVTGSIQAAKAKIEYEKGNTKFVGESNYGFGVFAGVGKEWWISDDWALGAVVFFSYSSVPDKDSDEVTISNVTFGAAFSATLQ